jgi:hypothetical protein
MELTSKKPQISLVTNNYMLRILIVGVVLLLAMLPIRTIVLAALISPAGEKTLPAKAHTGPKCLGLYCVGGNVLVVTLFKQLGSIPQTRDDGTYCYQTRDKQTFAYIETIGPEPTKVGDVFLSDFPNCLRLPIKNTAFSLGSWKTKEGIGLGSTKQEVLKAYGKPSKVTVYQPADQNPDSPKSFLTLYQLIIRGYEKGDKVEGTGDERFFYNNEANEDDFRASEFGIRNGKVSYIWLSNNE